MSRNVPRRPCRAGTRPRDRSRRTTRACSRSSRCAATARRAGSRIDLAQAAAALADLRRRLLRELEQRVVALVDRVEALGERREALLVVEQALGRGIDALPARLDARQHLRPRRVLRRIERDALERRRPAQRIEIGLEALAAVLDRRERARLTLRRERRCRARGAARASASRSRSPTAALAATTARLSRYTMNAANSRNVTASTPRIWNCLTTGRLPMTASFAARRRVARRAQLLHDRHDVERVDSPPATSAHLDLRRRHVEVGVHRFAGSPPNSFAILSAMCCSPSRRNPPALSADLRNAGSVASGRKVDFLPGVCRHHPSSVARPRGRVLRQRRGRESATGCEARARASRRAPRSCRRCAARTARAGVAGRRRLALATEIPREVDDAVQVAAYVREPRTMVSSAAPGSRRASSRPRPHRRDA